LHFHFYFFMSVFAECQITLLSSEELAADQTEVSGQAEAAA
jgi:hypothetical protein